MAKMSLKTVKSCGMQECIFGRFEVEMAIARFSHGPWMVLRKAMAHQECPLYPNRRMMLQHLYLHPSEWVP